MKYRQFDTDNFAIDSGIEEIEGECIEAFMRRVIETGEGVEEGCPLTYNKRSDGVRPECDIRTDRFEVARVAKEVEAGSWRAKRQERIEEEKRSESDVTRDTGGGETD